MYGVPVAQTLILVCIWLIPVLLASLNLRRVEFNNDMAKAIWGFVIVLIPVFGPLAFLILKPGAPTKSITSK
jgi:hypothetical protein